VPSVVPRQVSPSFLRLTAACWCVSAVTTLGLIFLPYAYAPIDVADGAMARVRDPFYMTRVAVALAHPLIVLVGTMGVAALRLRTAAGPVLCGFVFFLIWAATEAAQQSLTLVALNWTWRAQYFATADPVGRDALRAAAAAFQAVSDGLFLLILVAFVIADVAYAVATWGGDRLQRTVAVGFALAAALGVISGLTSFGPGVFPDAVMAVAYPLLQPAARCLTGLWVWREAGNRERFVRRPVRGA
jgi:hypothetical protein